MIGFDSMVGAHAENEELPVSLENVAGMKLGVDDWGKGKFSWGDKKAPPSPLWGPDGMGVYCAKDTAYSQLLYEEERVSLAANQDLARLVKYLILPGLEALCLMERNGIWVDRERLEDRKNALNVQKEEEKTKLLEFLPEDFRSRADFENDHFLRAWIFGEQPDGLGLSPITFTEKTGIPQVNEAVLSQLEHPAMDVLRELKRITKLLKFLGQWEPLLDRNGRLHPYFKPTGTVTGRRSCGDPNLMQVPRDKYIRSILGAPPGYIFLEVDYSQLEVRLVAWQAEEQTMLKVFSDPNGDIYRFVAAAIFSKPESKVTKEERQKAKAIVLGFIYGLSAKGFVLYAKQMFDVVFTYEEGVVFRDTFFTIFSGLVSWHERQKRNAHKYISVTSPLGRTRHLSSILSMEQGVRAGAERQAINSPIQGLGGDFTLASMVSLLPSLLETDECLLVGDIHDALLFQIREDVWERWSDTILTTMELPPALSPFHLSIPVRLRAEAKVGRYWGSGVEFGLDSFKDGNGTIHPSYESKGVISKDLREELSKVLGW